MNLTRSVRRAGVVGLLFVPLVVSFTGCGSSSSDGSNPSPTPAPTKTSLVGTHWLLQDGADLPTRGVAVTAEFADGRVGGSSGCNTYNAPYSVGGANLTIGPEIAFTAMACDPGPTAVETAYLARLPRVATYEIHGTTLALQDASGAKVLSYEAGDGASAILGGWTAASIYTGNSVESVAVGSKLTANFGKGEVSGDGGCNTFGGPYRAGKSSIELGPFRSTLKACADPAQKTQEQQYLAALELAASFEVTGDQLLLFRDDDGIAVTFVRTAVSG
jgi:heat shock protein HslJ